MREVCIHDYHEISGAKLQTVDVGGPATMCWDNGKIRKPEHPYPRPSLPARGFNTCTSGWSVDAMGKHKSTYDPIIPVYLSKLPSHFLCSIGTGVINNDDFPVEIAVQTCTETAPQRGT